MLTLAKQLLVWDDAEQSFLKTIRNSFIRKQQLWALCFLSEHHHYHETEHEGKFMTGFRRSATSTPDNTRMMQMIARQLQAYTKGCDRFPQPQMRRSHFPVKTPCCVCGVFFFLSLLYFSSETNTHPVEGPSSLPPSGSSADSTVWDPEGDTCRPEQLTSSPASTPADRPTDWLSDGLSGRLDGRLPFSWRQQDRKPLPPLTSWRTAWLKRWMDDQFNGSALLLHLLTVDRK